MLVNKYLRVTFVTQELSETSLISVRKGCIGISVKAVNITKHPPKSEFKNIGPLSKKRVDGGGIVLKACSFAEDTEAHAAFLIRNADLGEKL